MASMRSRTMPVSKRDAITASGDVKRRLARPFTVATPLPSASALIGLKPPVVLRNWLGGLTCHGCTASASAYSRDAVPVLVRRCRATTRESPGVPAANAVVASENCGCVQATVGIGR